MSCFVCSAVLLMAHLPRRGHLPQAFAPFAGCPAHPSAAPLSQLLLSEPWSGPLCVLDGNAHLPIRKMDPRCPDCLYKLRMSSTNIQPWFPKLGSRCLQNALPVLTSLPTYPYTGGEPRDSHSLGKYSTIELHCQPHVNAFNLIFN